MSASHESAGWIEADWPAPAAIRAGTSTRTGGVSQAPYASLNLADHVGDDWRDVAQNRRRLMTCLQLPCEPLWLQQVHGTAITEAHSPHTTTADAAWTDRAGVVCAVLTADCLPLLLSDRSGNRVAAVHVGWRGLAAGIVGKTIDTLGNARELLAWLGPCIGPSTFEVGSDVYHACGVLIADPNIVFSPAGADHWWLDLPGLVRQLLADRGVTECHGGNYCTYSDPDRFYSYRRDGQTGRMASFIWIDAARS